MFEAPESSFGDITITLTAQPYGRFPPPPPPTKYKVFYYLLERKILALLPSFPINSTVHNKQICPEKGENGPRQRTRSCGMQSWKVGPLRRSFALLSIRLCPRFSTENQRLGGEGACDWHLIASCIPGRTNKDCRKRWHYKVAATVNKGPWEVAEDERLWAAVQEHGSRYDCGDSRWRWNCYLHRHRWALVAQVVKTRNGDREFFSIPPLWGKLS